MIRYVVFMRFTPFLVDKNREFPCLSGNPQYPIEIHSDVFLWTFIKRFPLYCAHLAWFLFSRRGFCRLAKQIAGNGAKNSGGGGQLLVNLGSYHCTLVKQLGSKYE
jgi:hypothetical protein